MPTERQILGAKIRAEKDRYVRKHQKPHMGGYLVPENAEVDEHLAKKFGLPTLEIRYFMTWSRRCDHPWSAGACDDCPK
jgi:hypothetical protein